MLDVNAVDGLLVVYILLFPLSQSLACALPPLRPPPQAYLPALSLRYLTIVTRLAALS